MMRHTDVNLTMRLYSHTVVADRAKAVQAALPDLSVPAPMRAAATGTDNARATPPDADPRLALCLAQTGMRGPTQVDSAGQSGRDDAKSESPGIPAENTENSGIPERRGGDSNPRVTNATTGFRNRPVQPLRHLSQRRFFRVSGRKPRVPRVVGNVAACGGSSSRVYQNRSARAILRQAKRQAASAPPCPALVGPGHAR